MSIERVPLPEFDWPVVAVLRAEKAESYLPVVRVLVESGITGIELTLTTPGTIAELGRLRDAAGAAAVIGVGTVLSTQQLDQAIEAGADFIVTPVTDPDVIDSAVSHGVPIIPGGLTPTELHSAWARGASAVKVFPASTVGPEYVAHLHGPLPDMQVVPSGGVSISSAIDWLRAGAAAVSLGGPLIGDALKGGSLDALRSRADELISRISAERSSS